MGRMRSCCWSWNRTRLSKSFSTPPRSRGSERACLDRRTRPHCYGAHRRRPRSLSPRPGWLRRAGRRLLWHERAPGSGKPGRIPRHGPAAGGFRHKGDKRAGGGLLYVPVVRNDPAIKGSRLLIVDIGGGSTETTRRQGEPSGLRLAPHRHGETDRALHKARPAGGRRDSGFVRLRPGRGRSLSGRKACRQGRGT